jgi:hypothetical protein
VPALTTRKDSRIVLKPAQACTCKRFAIGKWQPACRAVHKARADRPAGSGHGRNGLLSARPLVHFNLAKAVTGAYLPRSAAAPPVAASRWQLPQGGTSAPGFATGTYGEYGPLNMLVPVSTTTCNHTHTHAYASRQSSDGCSEDPGLAAVARRAGPSRRQSVLRGDGIGTELAAGH